MSRALKIAAPLAFRFASASRTHPGLRRSLNEDRVLDRSDSGLWAVADGMGGHHDGGAAATQVIEALSALKPVGSSYVRLSALVRGLDQVNAALSRYGSATHEVSGSTLVALLAHEGHFACVWAGDSRAYRLREGELASITRDHSVVQQLVDAGRLAEHQRQGHPGANVITRAVGAAPRLELEEAFGEMAAGDVFLLCTDGLTTCVSDVEIAEILCREDPAPAADALIERALLRGGPDNVAVVVVHVA
jgi:serine/threonine protein phosphatase PrpC